MAVRAGHDGQRTSFLLHLVAQLFATLEEAEGTLNLVDPLS